MVFCGTPSKACERCRTRRLKVRPEFGNSPSLKTWFSGLKSQCSAISVLALAASVSELLLLVQGIVIHSSFAFGTKASRLRGKS